MNVAAWRWRRARYLFREVAERGHDLPLASVTKDGGVEFRSDLDISVWNPGDDTSLYKRVLPGDFVIGLRSFQSGIGYSAIEGKVSPAYTVLRPAREVEPSFYRHLFKSSEFISRLENVAQGIRQGRTISTEDFYSLRLAVPPSAHQRAIADYLDGETARIDTLIAKKRRVIQLLDERDVALVSETLLPYGARLTRLSRFASLQTGLTIDGGRQAGTDSVQLPYLRVANVQSGSLDLDHVTEVSVPLALAERSTLRTGDVLMTEGGDLDKLGRGALWEGQLPRCLHQNHVFAVRPLPGVLDPQYLALLTRTAHARTYFESTGVRTTNLASTNSSKILDFPVPVLPLDQQKALVREYEARAEVDRRLRGCITRQLKLLSEHRQALITAAVTGDLAIPGVAA